MAYKDIQEMRRYFTLFKPTTENSEKTHKFSITVLPKRENYQNIRKEKSKSSKDGKYLGNNKNEKLDKNRRKKENLFSGVPFFQFLSELSLN